MKKTILTILFAIISIYSYAQISFEEGYYIDNSGKKTVCYIKNLDWKNNPEDFLYKLTLDSEVAKKTINTTKEFKIGAALKYERHTVKIDQSSKDVKRLSTVREPDFVEKTVFLKSVVEGKASLFLYESNKQRRYFFSIDKGQVEPLIYKIYTIEDDQIAKNEKYKQQLWQKVRYENVAMSAIERVRYRRKDLAKYFNTFNSYHTDTPTLDYTKKEDRKSFTIGLEAGAQFSSFSIKNLMDRGDIDFDSNTSFRFGVEAAFILPFNNDKWSIVLEPAYQYFNAEKRDVVIFRSETLDAERTTDVEVEYQSIEVPLGIRHTFRLSKNSKLFVTGSFVIDLNFSSEIRARGISALTGDISTDDNWMFGIGYRFKDKYSLEIKQTTSRNLLASSIWEPNFSSFSINFGYTIFDK